MGYAVLWIENLSVSLLSVALVTACVGRLHRRWLQLTLWAITFATVALSLISVTLLSGSLAYQHQTWAIKWFVALLALTFSFTIGSLWLRVRGLQRCDDSAVSIAADWPRGKFGIFLAVAVVLHLMTLWNLDLAARQQLEGLRLEAGLLGQSVAPRPVADHDNAAILIQQASEAMGPEGGWPKAFTEWVNCRANQDDGIIERLSPQLQQVLHDWRGVLVLLHEAASKPSYYVDRDYHQPTMNIPLSDLQNIRYLAVLLALDGQDKAAKGDIRGAIQNINTRLALARHAASEPFAIALLVAAGIERSALSTLQGLLEHKKVSSGDLATLRIENRPSYRKLQERTLRMAEAIQLMTFYDIDAGRLSKLLPYISLDNGQEPRANHPLLDSAFAFVHRVFLLPGELDVSRQLSYKLQEAATKPYDAAKLLWKECQDKAKFHGGILLAIFSPTGEAVGTMLTLADARRQTARLGVAIYLYAEKNGHLPEKLNDLTPDFILSLPADPFDDRLMKFKRTDQGIVIYSVGPDMVDDGGSPFDSNRQTGDVIFKVPNGTH